MCSGQRQTSNSSEDPARVETVLSGEGGDSAMGRICRTEGERVVMDLADGPAGGAAVCVRLPRRPAQLRRRSATIRRRQGT